ncbi:hypothetical protein ACQKCU_00095 [Heyndrickxia sporothermodurans]
MFVKTLWIKGKAGLYFEAIKQNDLEGIVIKKIDSTYQIAKRSFDWLKIINYKYQLCYIYAIKKKQFGALLAFETGKAAGVIEFMKKEDKKKVYTYIRNHIKKETNDLFILDVPLVCNVKFRNYTSKGKLRIPTIENWIA